MSAHYRVSYYFPLRIDADSVPILDGRSRLASALCKEPSTQDDGLYNNHRITLAQEIAPTKYEVSRQFYEEIAQAFYSRVRFDFGTQDHLDKFLNQVSDINREVIRTVDMHTAFSSPKEIVASKT